KFAEGLETFLLESKRGLQKANAEAAIQLVTGAGGGCGADLPPDRGGGRRGAACERSAARIAAADARRRAGRRRAVPARAPSVFWFSPSVFSCREHTFERVPPADWTCQYGTRGGSGAARFTVKPLL